MGLFTITPFHHRSHYYPRAEPQVAAGDAHVPLVISSSPTTFLEQLSLILDCVSARRKVPAVAGGRTNMVYVALSSCAVYNSLTKGVCCHRRLKAAGSLGQD